MLTFSSNGISKLILLFRIGVYPYECMDDWEKFNETTLPEKRSFIATQIQKILQMRIAFLQKEFVKILK